jgi:ParB-like chromosome segregation protein Spo0J
LTEFPWPVHPAAELFPLLSDDELAELAGDIKAHGLHEAVWLYRDPDRGTVLLDGRNRWRACYLAGIKDIPVRWYDGDDPVTFSISLNVVRRHLTAGQKAAVASNAKPLYAEQAAKLKAQRERDERGRLTAVPIRADRREQDNRKRKSSERAASAVGASGRSVERFERVQRLAPDLAAKVQAGVLALDRAERIIRDREAEQRRIEQARQEAAAQPAPAMVDIRTGDFREVLADLTDVDAIITDPPYPHEYLPLLGDLAAWADKVLKPDGVLAVLMGQTYLPEVYRLLDGHRPYRWTACYLTPGNGYASMARRVQSNWKPLIVYGGGPRFADIVRSEGQDASAKSRHRWGQDYGAFHTIIERLTERGQTVADPFMGSGTTLLAAHALGRNAVGCDVDPAAVATARERLG